MKTKISQTKERLLRNPKAFSIAALFLFSAIVALLSVFWTQPANTTLTVINPPNDTLYSFSDDKVMSSFDGERLAVLYEAFEEASYSLKEVALQENSS